MSKVVIFPQAKLSEAQTYLAACDAHFAANFEPGGILGYVRPDYMGQHVTPFYGPGWTFDGSPFEEPSECAALRVDGVIHDYAIWPSEDE